MAGIVAATAAAVSLRRRRRAALALPGPVIDEVVVVQDAVTPADGVRFLDPAPADAARARLVMSLRPTRAGLNLLSVLVEGELTLTNEGTARADAIRVAATLTSARTDQHAELAAILAASRPALSSFSLHPGETRTIRIVAAQPRDAMHALTAGGRLMLVPLLVLDVRYADGGGERQLARSFVIGVERVDSPKLAPFWLDQPPRTMTEVGSRAHGFSIDR